MNWQPLPRLHWLVGTTALLSLTACGNDPQDPDGGTPEPLVCDAQTYAKAVRDAAGPDSEDIYDGLWAITPSNPKLIWNETRTAVRMVTWTTATGYTQGDNTLPAEVWLTPAPQLQALCKTVPAEQRVPRINQYLGLPPATEQDASSYIVEMWVKPEDMFRPCPDAEIDDTSCGLTFPASATDAHKNWMNANYAFSFSFWQQPHYPWTGLGYTYDWCNAETRVGASEYVVRAGSTVNVTGLIQRDTYCAP